ncbi:neuromedin-U receptor 1-like [Littorina saxatilis]|uniref:neuromedin-U receptor 1-like n=1 Tax=Littorina saxatilis TaxID=31220 RepID=UPI0038B4CD02
MDTTTTTTTISDSLNSTWNTSVDQMLLERMGPRAKDLWSATVLTVVYSLIFLSGSVGNICTCIVIVRNHCMQTTTNYYLFSLAVSDLLLLFFGLPPELFSIWMAYPWRFGEAFCYLRPTILELTSYASVLTITAFTVERYIAVCRPLLSHTIAVLSRAVKIIVAIWIVSLLAALPYAAHTRLFHAVTWPPTGQPVADSLVCSIPEKWLEGRMTYMFQISTFLFFLAPVTLIICLYILIGVAVRRSPLSRGSSDEHGHHTHVKTGHLPQQPRRVVIRMLVAVTVAFIICWAPFHTQRLMVLYVHRWTPELLAAQSHIFYISGVLYFVSSTVNPILYNVISRRYRVAFRQTICGSCNRYKNGSARYRLGSNTLNRNMLHGDMGYTSQHHRHNPLAMDSMGGAAGRRETNMSLRSDGSSEKKPVAKYKVIRSAPRSVDSFASSLCPDLLNCNKVNADEHAEHVEHAEHETRSPSPVAVEDGALTSAHKMHSLYAKDGLAKLIVRDKHSQDQHSSSGLNGTAAALERGRNGEANLGKHFQAILNGTRDMNLSSPQNGINIAHGLDSSSEECRALSYVAQGERSSASSQQQTFPRPPGSSPQVALDERSACSSPSPQPQGFVVILPQVAQDERCVRSSPSSHQHGLGRQHGASASLCKQCLSNTSSSKRNGPHNGVDAYHVSYNVNKPHTLV